MALLDPHKKALLDDVFRGRFFIRTSRLAELLDTDERTIQRWVQDGAIPYTETTPGGHYRFDRETVEDIIINYMPGKILGDETAPNTKTPRVCLQNSD